MDAQPNALARDLTHRSLVAALFPDQPQAERAIDALRAAGFTGDHIGVAMRDRTETGELLDDPSANHTVDSAVAGAVSGGLLGGVAGMLVGLVAALAIPGVGPIVAGGMLAAALGVASGTAVAGAGLGAAAGGLVGALNRLGLPETESQHFERGFRAGSVLLTVDAGPRAGEALGLLLHYGGDAGPMQALTEAGATLA